MLNDNSTQQLEMFGSGGGNDFDNEKPLLKENAAFLEKVYSCKKNIFFFIIFLFVSLISFSLGIERGKSVAKFTAIRNIADEDTQTPSKETIAVPPIEQQSVVREEKTPVASSVAKEKKEKTKNKEEFKKANYTIQVASVLQKKNINTELSKLKSKGYSAFSLPKGKYTVICVGKFNLKEEARQFLQKLKTKYPDSQIRRL